MEVRALKPIFIVGVPHSGTSWLGRVLDKHPQLIGSIETNYIWMWGNSDKPDDVLNASDLTEKIKKHIEQRITNHLKVPSDKRLCDKTPRNCLRIPFLHALFPDAQIILVVRDGRAVIRSIQRQNVEPTNAVMRKEIAYRLQNVPITDLALYLPKIKMVINRLLDKPIDYWGAKPPGWEAWLKEYSQSVVIAKQWVEATSIAREEGKKLPSGSFMEVKYEDLIFNPEVFIPQIAAFLDLDNSDTLVDYALKTAEPSRVNRWKETLSPDVLAEVQPHIAPLLNQLGYIW